jgi:hypothetical protein
VVDEDRDVRSRTGVLDSAQLGGSFPLAVDGGVERVAVQREDDRDEVRPSVRIGRRQPGNARSRQPRIRHLAQILPNGAQ